MLQVKTDRTGAYRRVTAQSLLLDIEPVAQLQQQLDGKLAGFSKQPQDDLHLTLFHFGKPQQLYREFKAANPKLQNRHFWTCFDELLSSSATVLDRPFELQAETLEPFGTPSDPVVALTFSASPQLVVARRELDGYWREFLECCGMSRQAKAERPYRPHLSLGRLKHSAQFPDLKPELNTLRFTASELRNVESSP